MADNALQSVQTPRAYWGFKWLPHPGHLKLCTHIPRVPNTFSSGKEEPYIMIKKPPFEVVAFKLTYYIDEITPENHL